MHNKPTLKSTYKSGQKRSKEINMFNRITTSTLGMFLLALAFSVVSFAGDDGDSLNLKFLVNASDSKRSMARKMMPVTNQLEKDLAKRLNRKIKINFRTISDYEKTIDAFVDGKADFGRLGPASYILARNRNPKIRLLAMENKRGLDTFNGLIIVRKDSPIQKLADLKGKTFAFGNINSTIGRYLSQVELMKAGIKKCKLAYSQYVGRHGTVFSSVSLKLYDAGALKESTFFERKRKNKNVRILHSFPNVTKPWLARADLDNEVYEALKDSLIHMRNPAALRKLKVQGFFQTSHEKYTVIEEAMEKAKNFDTCNQ